MMSEQAAEQRPLQAHAGETGVGAENNPSANAPTTSPRRRSAVSTTGSTTSALAARLARERDAKTDRMMERLQESDEQLAWLLSQAADSLSSLLPRKPVGTSAGMMADASSVPNDPADTQEADAEVFEKKAQEWFSSLNVGGLPACGYIR